MWVIVCVLIYLVFIVFTLNAYSCITLEWRNINHEIWLAQIVHKSPCSTILHRTFWAPLSCAILNMMLIDAAQRVERNSVVVTSVVAAMQLSQYNHSLRVSLLGLLEMILYTGTWKWLLIKWVMCLRFQNMSIIHSFKDHIVGFKMIPTAWFYPSFRQSYEWFCIDTLETVNSKKNTLKVCLFAWMVWNTNTITTIIVIAIMLRI